MRVSPNKLIQIDWAELEFQKCDVLIYPSVGHIVLLGWRSYNEAFAAGYKATMQQLFDFFQLSVPVVINRDGAVLREPDN